MQIPNGLGVLFAVAQLVLYAMYYKNTQKIIEARKRKTDQVAMTEVVVDGSGRASNNNTYWYIDEYFVLRTWWQQLAGDHQYKQELAPTSTGATYIRQRLCVYLALAASFFLMKGWSMHMHLIKLSVVVSSINY